MRHVLWCRAESPKNKIPRGVPVTGDFCIRLCHSMCSFHLNGTVNIQLFSGFPLGGTYDQGILPVSPLEFQRKKHQPFSPAQPCIMPCHSIWLMQCYADWLHCLFQRDLLASPPMKSPLQNLPWITWNRRFCYSLWLFYLRNMVKNTAFFSGFPLSGIHG